jgi:carboxyl-terminal processing protease
MRKERTRFIILTALISIALFFVLEKSVIPVISAKILLTKGQRLLESIMGLIRTDYLEERDPAKTVEGAYRGLINSLDPLSSYFDGAVTAKYLRKDPKFRDVGVVLFKTYGLFPQVRGIIKDSPAEKADIRLGDYISAIDDRSTLAMSLAEVTILLKDYEERPVSLKILRDTATLTMTVQRALLFPESYTFAALPESGYILGIHELFPPLSDDLKKAVLPQLQAQNKLLVLDLRNCHEGEIEEAQKLLNIFFKADKFGYFEKKGGVKEFLSCPREPELGKTPLAVWVNRATQGPAELVAGVLQESKRARVIGETTPGLVAKLELYPLQDEGSILLASGVFSLSSGKKLWEQGVTPDEKVAADDLSQAGFLKKTRPRFPAP